MPHDFIWLIFYFQEHLYSLGRWKTELQGMYKVIFWAASGNWTEFLNSFSNQFNSIFMALYLTKILQFYIGKIIFLILFLVSCVCPHPYSVQPLGILFLALRLYVWIAHFITFEIHAHGEFKSLKLTGHVNVKCCKRGKTPRDYSWWWWAQMCPLDVLYMLPNNFKRLFVGDSCDKLNVIN